MSINSDPNSDLNSAQNSALHQVRSCALRAHGVRSHAHNAHFARMSRAQRAQVARSACTSSAYSAQVVGVSRDLLPSSIPRPGRDIISKSQPPGQPSQVATSIPCRDLKMGSRPPLSTGQLAMSIPMSRPPFYPTKTTQVATSKWGRDTNDQCLLLRRQNRSSAQPGRDFNPWSRPQANQTRSRPQIEVATSIGPNLQRPLIFLVATLKYRLQHSQN